MVVYPPVAELPPVALKLPPNELTTPPPALAFFNESPTISKSPNRT
jgi:hypothetical protein